MLHGNAGRGRNVSRSLSLVLAAAITTLVLAWRRKQQKMEVA